MKFVGGSPEEMLTKLNGKEFEKYLDADVMLDAPDDFYDKLMGVDEPGLIDERIAKLQRQLDRAEADGNVELAERRRAQIAKNEQIKRRLRRSGLTKEEAVFAREHPALSVALDVAGVAHRAGVAQAKTGAVVGGSVALVRNVVACMRGEKEPADAAADVAYATGTSAAIGYVSAFAGTTMGGVMRNARSEYVRAVGNTNLATGIVTTGIDVARTIHRFFGGEITGVECVEQLGAQGVGEMGAALYATLAVSAVGAAPALVAVVAGMAGSMLGYAAATAVYDELVSSLKEYQLAHDERVRVERECAESAMLLRAYRSEFAAAMSQCIVEDIVQVEACLLAMDEALLSDDLRGYVAGNLALQDLLGYASQFRSIEEFDELMASDEPFRL